MKMALLLKCRNLAETAHFYAGKLGFAVEDGAEGTCTVSRGDARIIFTEGDLWKGPPGCTGTFYFYPTDVDAYFASVKNAVRVLWPLQKMPYGTREFGIEDCNGYILAFAN